MDQYLRKLSHITEKLSNLPPYDKMPCEKSLDEIKRELFPLKNYWVVIYGSYARGECTARSDIDVAVITSVKDYRRNLRIWWEILGKVPSYYDVRIFELLPLNIKIEVFKEHIVVFGDPLEISEYMYGYYRIWKDMEHRIVENKFRSVDEIIEGIRRAKKLKG